MGSAAHQLGRGTYATGTTQVSGSWARLVPNGIDATTGARYATESSGVLPAGFAKGALLADTIARSAALFAEAGADQPARLWRFDADRWSETALPADLPARRRAAYLLRHGVLFRAGGMDASGAVMGDMLALETHGARQYPAQTWVPRLDPALAWDVERGGLVYGGGSDANGQPHSDLWVAGMANATPELLLPDASGPDAPNVASGSLVLAGARSRQALVLGTSRVVGPVAGAWHGAWDGWHPRNLLDLGDGFGRDRCADGSTPRLCAAGANWWGEPGHFACSPAPAGTCVAPSEPRLVRTRHLSVQQARSADLDVMTTWVGADTHVDEWSETDPPVLRGRVGVRAPVIALRAANGVVAVSTDRGLVVVSRQDGNLHASDPLALCGRPLAAEPFGGGRWAMSTSAGFAVVSVDESGTPSIDEAVQLLPGANGWAATSVDPTECGDVDNRVCAGGRCGDGRARAPLALAGDRLVIAPALGATNGWLHGLGGGSNPDDPPVLLLGRDNAGWHVISQANVSGTVQALRTNGDALYAVTLDHHGKGPLEHSPTFLITGDQLGTGPEHDIAWWLTRRDTGDRRLRVVNGQVEVAVVAP